jgi:hypothetical protein
MSRKTNLTILYISAITNAVLINLQLLQITHLNWWLALLPTWFVVMMTLTKAVKKSLRNAMHIFHPVHIFAEIKA